MIDKTLFQCGKWDYKEIPMHVLDYMDTWRENNRDFKFVYMSDEQCGAFIENEYGSEINELYQLIPRGDNRADFWRYLILNKCGGFYADLDTKCFKSISTIINEKSEFIVTQNTYDDIGTIWENWFFGSSSHSFILEELIDTVIKNILQEECYVNANHTFFPFNQIVSKHISRPHIEVIGDEIKSVVGHIAAHDEWDNPEYFKNGGPR